MPQKPFEESLQRSLTTAFEGLATHFALPALAIVINQTPEFAPLFMAAFAAQGFFGLYTEFRSARTLEVVEDIIENPDLFRNELVCSPQFQEGFLHYFNAYVNERSEQKRTIFKRIFHGFVTSGDMENFEMERFYQSLSSLNSSHVDILRPYSSEYTDKPILDHNKVIEMDSTKSYSPLQFGKYMLSAHLGLTKYEDLKLVEELLSDLCNAGVLLRRDGGEGYLPDTDVTGDQFCITRYGQRLLIYIFI
jgi:hypothetical protein